jgi:ABC-type phosphate/phosphonate transport system substrate-binding protein
MARFAANARMYSVTPVASRRWIDLFDWLARKSGVDLAAVDHGFPAALPDLWRRPDLACGFICGFPFSQSFTDMQPVAAPIVDRGPGSGKPLYATQLIVAADAPFQVLEDTFGGRIGYTVPDSQSGYNAVRHHLRPFRLAADGPLYATVVGPLYTPRRVVEAVLGGAIDVGPLDSYALDLMLAHEPDLRGRVRIVATTATAPIPFLAAHPDCPPDVVATLRATLTDTGPDAERDVILKDLLITRFADVDVADYARITPADADPALPAWDA